MPASDGTTGRRPPRGLAKRLKGKRVCICLGAGGVGKTTTSAALALALAAEGQKVAVVTIDPAKRLAAALGLSELSGEPQPIDPSLFAAQGVPMKGELWAMMLDPKRTFDEIVTRLAPDERAREEILANPIYRELSSAVAGSQELSAISKLYELHHERDFDTIVLDTPPSRNALDFLEAPSNLLHFLEGRALKVFIAPGGFTARFLGRSTGLVFAIFARVTGVDMLGDLSGFFRSLTGVIDGFGERTRGVALLLRERTTTFLIVSSPEPEAAREAVFLAEKLSGAGMSRGGLIVNRVHVDGLGGHSPEEATALLAPDLGDSLAARAAHNLADFDVLVRRDEDTIEGLTRTLGEADPILVPNLDQDVEDLAGLARIARHLFA
ncbi:MAG TPA: ArsA-related P-loop ATPase [Solirubrobacteraceae bacterium]|jgi:anion-transporting  ArsA/GET3 family ATPase